LYGDAQFNYDTSCFTTAMLVAVNSCLSAIGHHYDEFQEGCNCNL